MAPPTQVGARLPFFIDQWEILDPPAVLSLVQGVQLEFNDPPPLMHARRAPDSIRGLHPHKQSLLRTEVNALLKKRAIERAPPSVGFYAHLFLVPKKNGKLRPVFNMRPLNQLIS